MCVCVCWSGLAATYTTHKHATFEDLSGRGRKEEERRGVAAIIICFFISLSLPSERLAKKKKVREEERLSSFHLIQNVNSSLS